MIRNGATVAVRGARRWRLSRASLKRAALAVLAAAAPRVCGEITIVLATDREVRRLNKTFRGKDKPTDVLSFEVGDGLEAGEPFGDVVVSVETAKRQAKDYDATLGAELERLVIHGTLHLCGYDHHERREAARMHGLTRKILASLSASSRPAVEKRRSRN